jgi:hypothetical protein
MPDTKHPADPPETTFKAVGLGHSAADALGEPGLVPRGRAGVRESGDTMELDAFLRLLAISRKSRLSPLGTAFRDSHFCVNGGSIRPAEVHWYEAHGVGRKGMKIKRFLDSIL